ncbi:MAG: site-2 protease family protein [Candidatus Doudnabacteria bacterium]|nr:site-2 protease family protein [Candidatus Doudnabacteria bacterium]
MDIGSIVITLIILLFSVIIHEVCHGIVADKLGDQTARLSGRLTLNPLPHLDLFGSILLPLFLYLVNSPILFGAAKPVPVNFFNLRRPKRDMALVSLAGPGSNYLLAIIFALPIRLGAAMPETFIFDILVQAALLNLVLGTFNFLPIPPLDGSKVLASFLSDNMMYRILEWERFGFLLIIFFLYTGLVGAVLVPIITFLAKLFLGFSII